MLRKFLKGFVFAFEGIQYAIKTQMNFRFHLLFAILVIVFGYFLQVSTCEWLILIFCIGFVLILELINTSIESLTDLASQKKQNQSAKIAKDTSAAAVLVGACASAVIGFLIFIPKIFSMIKYLVG